MLYLNPTKLCEVLHSIEVFLNQLRIWIAYHNTLATLFGINLNQLILPKIVSVAKGLRNQILLTSNDIQSLKTLRENIHFVQEEENKNKTTPLLINDNSKKQASSLLSSLLLIVINFIDSTKILEWKNNKAKEESVVFSKLQKLHNIQKIYMYASIISP